MPTLIIISINILQTISARGKPSILADAINTNNNNDISNNVSHDTSNESLKYNKTRIEKDVLTKEKIRS